MRQISIKVKLDSPIEAIKPLSEAGKRFEKSFSQFDRVFLPRGYQQAYGSAVNSPRLVMRTNTYDNTNDPTHLMILKRPIDANSNVLFQTQIMDYNQASHIVNQIGYELYAEASKQRQRLAVGSFTFYLDEILNHGWFLKVDRIIEADQPASLEELFQILDSIDLRGARTAPRYSDLIVTGEKNVQR